MIAVTNDLISSVVTDVDTDCEILWVQIDLIGTKSLHIGSFYRPPNSDMTALDNLNLSLERLTHRTTRKLTFGLTGCALLIVKYLYFGKQTGTELNGN